MSKTILTEQEANQSKKALLEAVKIFGSQNQLSIAIGDSRQAISSYIRGNRIIPVKRAIQIELATNRKIKRSMLRPDIF